LQRSEEIWMALRIRYWTCSDLADRLRGTSKPYAATGDEWASWHREAQERHPFRYWLAETGLRRAQNAIYWPSEKLDECHTYIRNRWVDRAHALTAHPHHIRPGNCCDLDRKMLHCLFDALVDHVEIERAGMQVLFENDKKSNYEWTRPSLFSRRRSRAAGLDYLTWECGLIHDEDSGTSSDDPEYGNPTIQAEAAREIIDLYKWYTEVRPVRPNPYDESGWSAYCEDKRRRGIDFLETDPKEDEWDVSGMLAEIRRLSEAHEAEDDTMLTRLVRIRKSLLV
jgi:hypothetical protein